MIRFYLTFDNKIMMLPVNPPSIQIRSVGKNQKAEIVKLGEINIIREKGLSESVIESFLPSDDNAPYVLTKGKFEKPEAYVSFIEEIRKKKSPLRLIITDTQINMLMSVESFEYGYRAGTKDVNYSLSLLEYKPYKAKEMKLVDDKDGVETTEASSEGGNNREKTGFAIGDNVVANGVYWRKPSQQNGQKKEGIASLTRATIILISPNKTDMYRYLLQAFNGNKLGWFSELQLEQIWG